MKLKYLTPLVLYVFFTAGCQQPMKVPLTLAEVFKIPSSAIMKTTQNGLVPDVNACWQRLNKLEGEVLPQVHVALNLATIGQAKDYKTRKNVGLLGVLLGGVGTTLNIASSANAVWVTAFSSLQTGATGYLATEEGLVDPFSNQSLQKTKAKIEELLVKYEKLKSDLLITEDTNSENWARKFREAMTTLKLAQIKCFSIIPAPT